MTVLSSVDRRDNTQVDIEVQSFSVEVVRFDDVVIVHFAHGRSGEVTALNNVIVVEPDEAKVEAFLCTIVNVGLVVLEGEGVFVVEGKGSWMDHSKKCATQCVETAVWPALVKSLA